MDITKEHLNAEKQGLTAQLNETRGLVAESERKTEEWRRKVYQLEGALRTVEVILSHLEKPTDNPRLVKMNEKPKTQESAEPQAKSK